MPDLRMSPMEHRLYGREIIRDLSIYARYWEVFGL